MATEFETNRRDLLKGRLRPSGTNLDDAAVRDCPHSDVDLGDSQDEIDAPTCLFHVGRRAMACQFEVILNHAAHERATEAAVCALDLVDRIEDRLSVYRESSCVSGLNRSAGRGEVAVDAEMFQLIKRCVTIYRETAGAFDITSTPLSKLWGFFRRKGSMPSPALVDNALDDVGSCHLCLDDETLGVRFGRPGLSINFNSIGKGYALDRCRDLLAENSVDDFLVHGGQSSVIGHGSRQGASADECGWTVALRHPLRPEVRLLEFDLVNQALATSGSATQSFHHRGKRYGHILDPRTGWPADSVHSATVVAESAALADALSTAFYVLGVDAVVEYCRQHERVSAILVAKCSRAGGVKVHVIGAIEPRISASGMSQVELVVHEFERPGNPCGLGPEFNANSSD